MKPLLDIEIRSRKRKGYHLIRITPPAQYCVLWRLEQLCNYYKPILWNRDLFLLVWLSGWASAWPAMTWSCSCHESSCAGARSCQRCITTLGTWQLVTSHDSRGGRPLLKVITSYTSSMISCRKSDTRRVWPLSKLTYSRLNYTELTHTSQDDGNWKYLLTQQSTFPDIVRDNKDCCEPLNDVRCPVSGSGQVTLGARVVSQNFAALEIKSEHYIYLECLFI